MSDRGHHTKNEHVGAFVKKIWKKHFFLTIHIFSEGKKSDFNGLIQILRPLIPKLSFHLNEDVKTTFHHFVEADILIADSSHFSLTASYLNQNIVYALPFRIGGLQRHHIPNLQNI